MQPSVSRNAPCPCGSNRRYKDCHGAVVAPEDGERSLSKYERTLAESPDDALTWAAALDAIIRYRIADHRVGQSLGTVDRSIRVAVVTPYHAESLALLERCHRSVALQTYACRHILVADGSPRKEIDRWDAEHLKLPTGHRDFGDTPRAKGGERAAALGFTAIAYLDADNAMRPRHVETLVARHLQTGAAVCYSGRSLQFPDDSVLPFLSPEDSAGHIDTNTLLLTSSAFDCLDGWTRYPSSLSVIDDRLFVEILRARAFPLCCTGALTARYTVNRARLYALLGKPIPPDARGDLDRARVAAWLDSATAAELDIVGGALGFPIDAFLRRFLAE
jgi:hypothetical protein